MAIRQVELKKNLEKLAKRRYSTTLKSAHFSFSSGEEAKLDFAPGITVLCGRNGAGKSSTLGLIWRCLTGRSAGPAALPSVPAWISRAQLSARTSEGDWNTYWDHNTKEYDETCPVPVLYLDPSAETEQILVQFRKDDNPEDLLEGIDPSHFSDRQLELISLVVGRRYSEVSTYEVVAFREDDTPVPFFFVSTMGNEYSLLQMGRGELNAAYIIWQLSQLERGSVVLLEEPEAHLAEPSQESLLHAVTAIVVERDLTIIVSSHSPGFFQSLPDGHSSLVDALPLPRIRSKIANFELSRHLSPRSSAFAPILLVEDSAAAGMLLGIMEELNLQGFQDAPVCYAENGESGILKVVNEVTPTRSRFRPILGILDGDQRHSGGKSQREDVAYLPGSHAPEEELRIALDQWRWGENPEWEPKFTRDVGRFQMSLERLDGTDHHDWFTELSRDHGGPLNLMASCISLVLLNDKRMKESQDLKEWLSENTIV